MASLLEIAKKSKDPLRPFGTLDVSLYYALVAPFVAKFTKGRELAAKNLMPKGPMPSLIKRGSDLEPLSCKDIVRGVDEKFLKTRAEIEHLRDAEGRISVLQRKIWSYFLPRKLSDFFYATNGEKPGRPIDRVFFDLDRGRERSFEDAREAARVFVDAIRDDADFWSSVGKEMDKAPFVAWTGSSFHVYLFFKKPMPSSYYSKHFQYSIHNPLANFTGRWAAVVEKAVKFKIAGGHQKIPDAIVVDPSQTPSGKLCRVPLGSLHMRDALTVDGVSLPVQLKVLGEKGITKLLSRVTPGSLVPELSVWSRNLPSRFR
ncbi:MAG TPA: hypothetical protein VGQ00_00860 [Candidatus Norongarragalinales archaeon]|jgi:hypothetical protein|nr:hypothetical protein [Candidatus Norongarragalinales archaeon]